MAKKTLKEIAIEYANKFGGGLPLSPEELLNAVVLWVQKYVNNIPENEECEDSLNLENGDGEGSLQQIPNVDNNKIDFAGKNPSAFARYPELNGEIPYGATGEFANSFGGKSWADGKRSFTSGTTTVVLANYASAGGNSTVVGREGVNGNAEGAKTFVDAPAGHAEGQGTQVLSELGHAEGLDTVVEEGYKGGHTEGFGCIVRANFAHAEGYFASALHDYSHTNGYLTISGRPFQFVCGAYNIGKQNTLLEVGNGNERGRKNAFEVLDDNRAKVFGVPIEENDVVRKKELDELRALVTTLQASIVK